ncbi:MAG: LacI family transcriptional regulator [Actinobacteria bacterium]|nr:LacI family transcriptional regulator [Actinomycetota bacterium]
MAALVRATLADVAKLAGVSAKTVSRVYSSPELVSDDTRTRVREAAERLRFTPNVLARDLRLGGVTRTIGFVTAEFTNPFYIQVAAGIEQECSRRGYTMILASATDSTDRERDVIETLVAQRVQAILLVPLGGDYSYLDGERHLGTVIVAVDRPIQNLLADTVLLADADGGYQAASALVAHGHRRIGFVANPAAIHTTQERLKGYRQALAEAGVEDTARWERTSDDPERSLDDLVAELLDSDDPPTAIVGGNNRATVAAVRQLRRRGLELALIGFDDFEMADAFGISVIAHDPAELGRRAVELAFQRLEDPTGVPETAVIGVHYVPRGSGETAPPDAT